MRRETYVQYISVGVTSRKRACVTPRQNVILTENVIKYSTKN